MTHDDHERIHSDCAGCRAEFDESSRLYAPRPRTMSLGVTTPLSYLRCDECEELLEPDGSCPMHGHLDFDIEGQPEFNGAFG